MCLRIDYSHDIHIASSCFRHLSIFIISAYIYCKRLFCQRTSRGTAKIQFYSDRHLIYDTNIITVAINRAVHQLCIGFIVDNRVYFSVKQILGLSLNRITFHRVNFRSQLILNICHCRLHVVTAAFKLYPKTVIHGVFKHLCRIVRTNSHNHPVNLVIPSCDKSKDIIRSCYIICSERKDTDHQ